MKPITQNHFSVVLVVLACVLGYFADRFGVSGQIFSVKFINVAMLLGTSSALIFFTHDTKYDVIREVFDEGNVAAALYIGLSVIALAIACTVVS